MTILKDVVNYILNLGGPVFVPLIMLILGLVAGLKFKKINCGRFDLGGCFLRHDLGR